MSKQPPPAPALLLSKLVGRPGTGWLVGCFGFNGPLRQYFSLYRAVSQREGEGRERIDESKNVQTTPTRTYCKRNRPLPYCNQNCRTPRHWKFNQHHRTTRPPPPQALEVYPTQSHHPKSYNSLEWEATKEKEMLINLRFSRVGSNIRKIFSLRIQLDHVLEFAVFPILRKH